MKDQDGYKQDPTWLERTGGFARDMTLRDHFAGMAMQVRFKEKNWTLTEITEQAYMDADLMLKERAK
jgi:hypothetical protein